MLGDEAWKVYGLGESLLVKALAVVYPERWLPVFPYGGSKGKKRLAQAPMLDIEPIDDSEFDTPAPLCSGTLGQSAPWT